MSEDPPLHPSDAEIPLKIQQSLESIAQSLGPNQKSFGEKFQDYVKTPSFLIGTVLLALVLPALVYGYQTFQSNHESKVANFEQLQSVRDSRHRELEAALEKLTRDRAELFLFETATRMLGGERTLNQSYLAFGKRTLSDLEIRRSSSLIDEIDELNKSISVLGAELGYPKEVYDSEGSDSEKISSHLILGLILAQEMHVGHANAHLNQCLKMIDKTEAVLDDRLKLAGEQRESSSIKIEVEMLTAEKQLLHRIAVHAEATIAVVNSIKTIDSSLSRVEIAARIRDEFEKPLERTKRFPGIRGRLLRGVVLAVRSVVADAILASDLDRKTKNKTRGESLPFTTQLNSFHADLLSTYESIGGYTEKHFKNYVDDTRYFILLSWAYVEVESIGRQAAGTITTSRRTELLGRIDRVADRLNAIKPTEKVLLAIEKLTLRLAPYESEAFKQSEAAILDRLAFASRQSPLFRELVDLLVGRTLEEIDRLSDTDIGRNKLRDEMLDRLRLFQLDNNWNYRKLQSIPDIKVIRQEDNNTVPQAPVIDHAVKNK